MNVHDEVICVNLPYMTDAVAEAVRESVEAFRSYVPLIGMEWCLRAKSWAEKSGVENEDDMLIITYEK